MTKRCKNCGWPNDDSSMTCQKCGSSLDGAMPSPSSSPLRQSSGNSGDGGESLRRTVSEKQFFATGDDTPEPMVTQRESMSVKQCPNCHYQLREGMKNCPNCGTSIADANSGNNGKKCPKCGQQNAAGSKFCCQCGANLDAPAPSPAQGFVRQAPAQQAPAQQAPAQPGPIPVGVGVGGARGGTVNPWMQPNNSAFCTLKPVAWEGENVQHQTLSFSGTTIVLNRANTDPNNQSITSAEQAVLTNEDGEWYIQDKSTMHTTYVMAGRKLKLQKGDTIILGNRLFEFN